ncbi:MAG TPA: PglZ domain-containing protein, partial [Candidatus Bathyarchaeota archaeon]|nr:PglZ domain-containing protein [Candidatus Bathyarchaeota archaeon]
MYNTKAVHLPSGRIAVDIFSGRKELVIILALDALDLGMVEKYGCRNLMQVEYGQTDLSEFELERTVVLWASFLTGRNMEAEIPVETQWEFTLKPEETFLKFFETYKALDVPAFSLKQENHKRERVLLKKYFDDEVSVEEYDETVWRNHEENKREFFEALGRFDLVMGYFDLADAIGHLSFGIPAKMEAVYRELEGIAKEVKSSVDDVILVISDHGMKPVGRYGDHTKNGFYSFNRRVGLNLPKITEFFN